MSNKFPITIVHKTNFTIFIYICNHFFIVFFFKPYPYWMSFITKTAIGWVTLSVASELFPFQSCTTLTWIRHSDNYMEPAAGKGNNFNYVGPTPNHSRAFYTHFGTNYWIYAQIPWNYQSLHCFPFVAAITGNGWIHYLTYIISEHFPTCRKWIKYNVITAI